MKIVIAHDGSAQADKALEKAAYLAAMTQSSLTVLSVVPDLCMMEISEDDCRKLYDLMTEESRKRLEKMKSDLAPKGIVIESDVQFGNAAEIILKVCADKKADLVIIWSHGRHGAKKFLLGSVSSKVVDHAPCDVLVVK